MLETLLLNLNLLRNLHECGALKALKALNVGKNIERSNTMTFKEFVSWCNNRAADGCWGLYDATVCITIVDEVRELPFWKREKFWKEKYEEKVIRAIVEPIEKKISELRR